MAAPLLAFSWPALIANWQAHQFFFLEVPRRDLAWVLEKFLHQQYLPDCYHQFVLGRYALIHGVKPTGIIISSRVTVRAPWARKLYLYYRIDESEMETNNLVLCAPIELPPTYLRSTEPEDARSRAKKQQILVMTQSNTNL